MKTCRICLEEEGEMIQPCLCKGTTADVHPECLHRWLMVSGKRECEICNAPYEMEDVVEFKWKLNPSCSVSDTSSTIVYLCCMLKFMIQTFALLSDYDPMFVLFTSNAADVFLMYLIREYINVMPSWLIWKVASTLSFLVSNVMVDIWLYVFYEASITLIVAIFAYIYLVYTQSYQHVRYIYYDEETV